MPDPWSSSKRLRNSRPAASPFFEYLDFKDNFLSCLSLAIFDLLDAPLAPPDILIFRTVSPCCITFLRAFFESPAAIEPERVLPFLSMAM